MESHILFTILAIVTILGINFSTAAAMEEEKEFELPESGRVITFNNSVTARTMGGLDPPGTVASPKPRGAQSVDRFEMGESGIIIDFNPRSSKTPRFGFPWTVPLGRPPASPKAAPGLPVFEAYEMPESGRLIVFPRQVEKRREQAIRMPPLKRVVSGKH